jgi:hypothetical membrane protein
MGQGSTLATRIGAISGLVGAAIMVLVSVVTAIAYTGTDGEAYSPFNHFVSELGRPSVSELATVFNIGLIVAGLCLVAFAIGLRPHVAGAWGWAVMAIGIVAGLFAAMVGVFPMGTAIHTPVAGVFFLSAMLMALVFSVALVAGQAPAMPRWLLWPGAVAVTASLAFLVFVATGGLGIGPPAERPAFLAVTTVEWLAIVATAVWAACVSLVLLRSVA